MRTVSLRIRGLLLLQIVASLTENVKKMDLVEQPKVRTFVNTDNKENRSSKRPPAANVFRKKPTQITVQVIDTFTMEPFDVEVIEPPLTDDGPPADDDDEPIDPTYAMDYVADIMNLLYTLEKRYPLKSSFLSNAPASSSIGASFVLANMATLANGSATRPWKLTTKHRTILVGWIIQLFYARFHLSQDAMHM